MTVKVEKKIGFKNLGGYTKGKHLKFWRKKQVYIHQKTPYFTPCSKNANIDCKTFKNKVLTIDVTT